MRRAIRFVSDALRDDPDRPLGPVIDEAALRFDLDPRQTEFLIDFYRKARSSQ
jgi:hypothetical protein